MRCAICRDLLLIHKRGLGEVMLIRSTFVLLDRYGVVVRSIFVLSKHVVIRDEIAGIGNVKIRRFMFRVG